VAGAGGVPFGTAANLPGDGQATAQPMSALRECPRWRGPDDYLAVMEETPEQTERRRAAGPCSRLADLLSPELRRIGPG
jgi:hypothetical protein